MEQVINMPMQENSKSVLSSSSDNGRKVVYIYDNHLSRCTDKILHINGRSRMVHELIKAYELLELMEWKPSKLAGKDDLLRFHSQDYVDFLFSEDGDGDDDDGEGDDIEVNEDEDNYSEVDDNQADLDEFGLGYDCPVFKGLGKFALRIAGGTLAAAEELVNGGADVAINWCGGWHHAQRSEASGFCYVNDIVLGIHELQKKFKHILYVDLDAHHGDGVENAFTFTDKVMTLSFHHFETGYFPGTGKMNDVGTGRGRFYALNVPLKAAVTDNQFIFIFDSIFNSVIRNFQPEAIVVQCGADSLAKDPLGAFNLTSDSIVHCVKTILNMPRGKRMPTLLLGGGGYNIANAARLWTSVTAQVLNRKISNDIPDNLYFLKYGPDFELAVQPSLRKNENDDEYISELIENTLGQLLALKNKRKETS